MNLSIRLNIRDESPTKRFIIDHRDQPEIVPFFNWACAKRPEYELFHIPSDPENIHNLASEPRFGRILEQLKTQLADFLIVTKDPSLTGNAQWDQMPFYLLGEKAVPVSRETHPALF